MHGCPRIESLVRTAAIAAMLGPTAGCVLDGDLDDDDADASADDSGGEPSTGAGASTGEEPSTGAGTPDDESSGGLSGTGVDPTSDGGTTTGAGTSGEESTSAGEPMADCTTIDRICATFSGSELMLFRLASGDIIDTFEAPFGGALESHSIAWVGNDVLVCGGEPQTLQRIDVTTGVLTDSGLQCTAVTDVQGALLVRRGSYDSWLFDYAYYDDFAAVMEGAPSSVTNYSPDIHRITATDDTLISAWHSDNHFSMHDLATAAPLGDVMFEGYDDWIMGMEVVEGQLVIGTWFADSLQHVAFDLATGARTCEVPSLNPGDPLDCSYGLACQWSPPEPPPR